MSCGGCVNLTPWALNCSQSRSRFLASEIETNSVFRGKLLVRSELMKGHGPAAPRCPLPFRSNSTTVPLHLFDDTEPQLTAVKSQGGSACARVNHHVVEAHFYSVTVGRAYAARHGSPASPAEEIRFRVLRGFEFCPTNRLILVTEGPSDPPPRPGSGTRSVTRIPSAKSRTRAVSGTSGRPSASGGSVPIARLPPAAAAMSGKPALR